MMSARSIHDLFVEQADAASKILENCSEIKHLLVAKGIQVDPPEPDRNYRKPSFRDSAASKSLAFEKSRGFRRGLTEPLLHPDAKRCLSPSNWSIIGSAACIEKSTDGDVRQPSRFAQPFLHPDAKRCPTPRALDVSHSVVLQPDFHPDAKRCPTPPALGIRRLVSTDSVEKFPVPLAFEPLSPVSPLTRGKRVALSGANLSTEKNTSPGVVNYRAPSVWNFFMPTSSTPAKKLPMPPSEPVSPLSPGALGQVPGLLGMKGLFPDPATLKEKLLKPTYDVKDRYKTSGFCQWIARSRGFESITFIVILLNSVWIGIATDCNKADVLSDAPKWIQIAENLFCGYFFFELGVRFFAFHRTYSAFTDGWFNFDFVLVVLMVYETWIEPGMVALFRGGSGASGLGNATVLRIFRLTRLTRLTRIARIARLLRQIPELAILSKALLLAMRSVGATLILLVVGIYVFSIFFTQMLADSEMGLGQFETVPMGMHTLLVQGILADQSDIINGMLSTGVVYYVVILIYMLIIALTITDMLIGVITEVIESVAAAEKEEMVKNDLADKILEIRRELDSDRSNTISKTEFASLVDNETVMRQLVDLGVDVVALIGFADMIFEEEDVELSCRDFSEIILGFRESEGTVKRQLELKKFVKQELSALEIRLR